jgi:hypothetical protein
MVFHLPKLGLPLLVAAMGAMAMSAGAQQSDRSIIFSSPQSNDAQSATPSLSPENSQLPVLPDSLEAPDSAFNFRESDDLPVSLPSTAMAPQDPQMKKMLEERKNWTLMTPEEILDVTPAEKLLEPPERDAAGQEKNATQLERYLDRENRLRGSLTNDSQMERNNSPWNFSRDRDSMVPFDFGRDSMVDAAEKINRFLNSQRNGGEFANLNQNNYGWDSFSPSAPQTPTKPDMEQVATMERFRQLLEPSPVSASDPSPDSKFFSVPNTAPVLDPNITQPDFVPDPAGASFTPLSSGIGKPAGLTPLPGIVTPVTPPVTVPAWAPQPPPWLSQGPQPFVMPQRKF